MVKRVDSLTAAQRARFDEWADRWIEVGLRTGAADRQKFEAAARRCYRAAGLPWHGNVVWVPSPLVAALAAPVAALVVQLHRQKTDLKHGAVRDAVRDAVDGAVDGAVGGAVDGAVRDAVGGAVDDGAEIRQAIADTISRMYAHYMGGQFWVGAWYWGGAYTSFFREVCDLELAGDLWEGGLAYEATMEAACWWYPHRDFIMVCERPTAIHRELTRPDVRRGWGSHRLHCADGPAVAFADGWGVYAIHGVQIPFKQRHIVEQPQTITVAQIEQERNAEIRRVMIDRYGPARYVMDSGAKIVDRASHEHPLKGLRTAVLLRKEVPDDEPIIYVDLLNSTPEPDGTTKRYMIRVSPHEYGGETQRNVHAAAASTWRNADGSLTYRDWREYAPRAES